MKAQSAIEYLTTYGWMLMSVALATAGVYTIVGNQCIDSYSGFTDNSVGINNFGITADDKLLISMRNSRTEKVEIDQLVLAEGVTIDVDRSLDPKTETSVAIKGFETVSECNEFDTTIKYSIGSLDGQRVSGSIQGSYNFSGEPPTSPGDFEVIYTG